MIQGPNVKKLIVYKMSMDAIKDGSGMSGFEQGIRFLSDPKRISETAKKATEWVEQAIQVVRQASEPNPWRLASDELIVQKILDEIEARKSKP